MSQLQEDTDTLQATEVAIENLSQEELVRLLNDKQIEVEHYKMNIDQLTESNKELLEMYNSDMQYITTINGNTVKVQRKKEDAIRMIISGTMQLLTIDRDVIAPDRKENN